jgi:hypothetical protein
MRNCAVCIHPSRHDIEVKMLRGCNLLELASEYNISRDSIYNHNKLHITKSLVKIQDKMNLTERFDLLNELEEIVNKTKDIFNKTYAKGKYITSLKALDSQKSTYDVLCKMLSLYQQSLALENENLRLKNGEHNSEDEEKKDRKFEQQLKILTFNELLVLRKIQDKIIDQTNTVVIADIKSLHNDSILFDLLAHPEQYLKIQKAEN